MKIKITVLATAILLFANIALPTFSLAQVTQEWVSRYNGPTNAYDQARSVAVDDSGNVYVTGYNSGNSSGIGISSGSGQNSDYVTIKYNSMGVQQWAATYNGPGNGLDDAYSLAVDGLGNVYVTGRSAGSSLGSDYATIKYNSSGVQQWVARYNGPGNFFDRAYSLAVDGSGNVYVTGGSEGSGTSSDFATIKYDSTGVQQWASRYNGPGNSSDEAYSLAVDGSGNVYVTGYSFGNGTAQDYATIKYDSSGIQQWAERYNGQQGGSDYAQSIAVDDSGNVYVTGYVAAQGASSDMATVKYNSSGAQQWIIIYNGPSGYLDQAYSVAVDSSGNVYVTGYSIGNGTSRDYATIKYNSTGAQQWVASYNGWGSGLDYAYSLALDGSGNVYVTGMSEGNGTGYDYATIKYNSSGVQQWAERYNGPGNGVDNARSLVVDGSGNVYVTGQSIGNGTVGDYATIKYSQQTVGIETIPDGFSLFQLFPNPATNQFTIVLDGNHKKVQVNIADITGKIIYSTTAIETQQVEVNANDFASGIYVVQIKAAEFIETKKLVVKK